MKKGHTPKRIPFYRFQIAWNTDGTQPLSLVFKNPPVRSDIERVVMGQWRELPTEKQDECWECVLILAEIPEEPWTGKIPSVYGLIVCEQLFMVDNG